MVKKKLVKKKKISNETKKRLVYAKWLFIHGQEHANEGSEVSRMIAIHNFDNSIELLLKCIATKYDIVFTKKQDYSFKQLWDYIEKKRITLPLKTQMINLP